MKTDDEDERLPPCDPELFQNGDVVGIYDNKHGSKAFESLIKHVADYVGVAVDWNVAAGRAVVRCKRGCAGVVGQYLEECLERLSQGRMDYSSGSNGKKVKYKLTL